MRTRHRRPHTEEIALYIGMSGIDFDLVDGDTLRPAMAALAARLTRAAG